MELGCSKQRNAVVLGTIGALGFFQVVGSLKVQPKVHGRSQCPAQPDGAVHRDAAALFDEIIDPAHRQAGGVGELRLRDAALFEHFLPQDAARVDARQAFGVLRGGFGFGDGFHGSVVVGDLDGGHEDFVRIPEEADAPLLVDAHAPLAFANRPVFVGGALRPGPPAAFVPSRQSR